MARLKATQSVYVIGGAGTGKSTFMEELLTRTESELGPLQDFHSTPNAKGSLVTLRGHSMVTPTKAGIYLGVWRDQFPGTDGLDRASSITGEQWLVESKISGSLPEFILAEGATLATRWFLFALQETSELLVLALRCDPMVHDLRLLERGAGQVSSFVTSTVTKTENLVKDLISRGAHVRWVDSDDEASWQSGLLAADLHLAA